MKTKPSVRLALALSASLMAFAPMHAYGQADDEVISVGTLIKRKPQSDRASPVAEIGDLEIAQTGAKNLADLTQTLTINTGAENNPDAFTQNATTGTSNINLRGLGVQSTLVLLNGRRQVLSAAVNNGGYQFVDTASLVPMIAVQNLEILKDGASATYGSDAVAGVANFSTYQDFDGVKLNGSYQTVDGYDSDEYVLQGMLGKNFDRGNIMGAVSYTKRNPLTTGERRLSRVQDDSSVLGNPGAFVPLGGPLPAGLPLIDPGCTAVGGQANVGLPGAAIGIPFDIGTCGFDFGDYFNLIADEERMQGYAQADFDLTDTISWKADFSYADNETIRGNSPSFPFLQTAFVPASHPNNIFGPLAPGGLVFLGRAVGNGGAVSPNVTTSETYRFSTELSGSFGETSDWRLSYVRGKNNHIVATEDTVTNRMQCALTGTCEAIGGPAGFFNPFSSAYSTAPNDPAILDYIIDTAVRDLTSKMDLIEGVYSTDLFEADGGTAVWAIGAQYRKEDYTGRFDAISNADNFGFLIGDQDYDGDQNVWAVFSELAIPVAPTFDLQLALRFEDYGGEIGSTIDPKVAVLFRPDERLSLRASYSTSFRAPTVFQQFGQGTALVQIIDPTRNGATSFGAARTLGNQNLKPEQSQAFNVGTSFELIENLEANLDFWHFNFTDVIIPENYQAVVNADPTNTDRIIRNAGNQIVQVNTNYVNASSVKTNGVDFGLKYTFDTEMGTFVPFIDGTYVRKYDLNDPQAGRVEGAGQRNFNNFGTSVPKLRLNTGFGWQKGVHGLNVFARHIGGYDDDQNAGREVDSHTTFDAQYKLNIGELVDMMGEGTSLTLGAINIGDENPPQVFTNGGFDSKVHDPRGRLLYVGVDVEF